MNKSLFLFCSFAFHFACSAALAQTSATKEGAPSPPYVATVTAPASWTVRFAASQERNPQDRYLKEIRVFKTRDKKQEITSWSDGPEGETWYVDDYIIFRQPHFAKDDVAILKKQADTATSFFSANDFSGLEWITENTFQRTENHQGKACHYYEQTRISKQDGIPEPLRTPDWQTVSMAWIDARTRLPVIIEEAGITRSYTFAFGAPKSLTLPPLFAAQLEKALSRSKAAAQHTPSPQ